MNHAHFRKLNFVLGHRLHVLALIAVSLLGVLAACDLQRCSEGSVCTLDKSSGPSEIPTPAPSPSKSPTATPTPDPCRASAILAAFSGGSQANTITVIEAPKRLDATAKNAQGDIPDGCNQARFPEWKVSTPTTCSVAFDGKPWNPLLDGLKVGACEVRACLRQTGDGPCFPDPSYVPLAGETPAVTSPAFSVEVR